MTHKFYDMSVKHITEKWLTFKRLRTKNQYFGKEHPEYLTMHQRENLIEDLILRLHEVEAQLS
jgi:hypothetical protein